VLYFVRSSSMTSSDSFYVQDCRLVQNNTHAIQTLTGQISKQVGMLKTDQDFRHCRSLVDDAVRQATETRTALARILEHQNAAHDHAEKNNRRMMYHKLSDNLGITARVLEDVVRRFQAEEAKRPTYADADAAGGEERGQGAGMDFLEQEAPSDRPISMKSTDEDVRCLKGIYTDLASAAKEAQHSTYEALETHVSYASGDIELGQVEFQAMSRSLGQRLKENGVAVGLGALAFVSLSVYVLG